MLLQKYHIYIYYYSIATHKGIFETVEFIHTQIHTIEEVFDKKI